jgi:hypothetical protein
MLSDAFVLSFRAISSACSVHVYKTDHPAAKQQPHSFETPPARLIPPSFPPSFVQHSKSHDARMSQRATRPSASMVLFALLCLACSLAAAASPAHALLKASQHLKNGQSACLPRISVLTRLQQASTTFRMSGFSCGVMEARFSTA